MNSFRFDGLLAVLGVLLMGCSGKGEVELSCDEGAYFDADHILEVSVSMDAADWDSLRLQSRSIPGELAGDCRAGPFEGGYTYFPASIEIDGEGQSEIGIRKKGFIGSQSTTKPGFRINLDEYVEDKKLFCTDNVTLNNSVQDPALVRQCLSYKLFRQAGIPAPRCNFARVEMNGEDLGVYVHVEPIKKQFLRANFGSDEGDLYEGTLSDFTSAWHSTLEPKNDETDPGLGPIKALVRDLEDKDKVLEDVLREHFDFDQLLTFLAVETWVGHWDGYGGNQNNFYVYRDPDTDKLHFIPWGADGTMDPEMIEEGWIPSKGYIVNRMLRDEALADALYARMGGVRDLIWDVDGLLDEVDLMETRLSSEIDPGEIAEALDGVRYYLTEREDSIKRALPVTEVEEFGKPFCMVEVGSFDAAFETSWTEAEPDLTTILEAGGVDFSLSWDGYDIPVEAAGGMMGMVTDTEGSGEDWGRLILAAQFTGENGPAVVLPVVYMEPESMEDGADLEVGLGAEGSLLFMDESTGWEAVELGQLWDGHLEFDVLGTTPGAEVSGSISSGVYSWTEIDG